MNDYKISVVIPAHNSEKFIGRAIKSVLSQSLPPLEIIVVDDGSVDGTKEAVAAMASKVRYIYQENSGPSAARNAGIIAAKGDWIAFLDSDDQWLENRLAEQLRILRDNPELCWLSGNYITCDCGSGRKSPYLPPRRYLNNLNGSDTMPYYKAVVKGMAGCTDNMLIKRHALIEVGLFSSSYTLAEDLDLWWKIAARHPVIGLVWQPTAIYHLGVQGSVTKKTYPAKMYAGLINEHRAIAAKTGVGRAFDEMAAFMVMGWVRSMLFNRDRKPDASYLVVACREILPLWFRILASLGARFAPVTERLLRTVSFVVRKLKLRKRVVLPPRQRNSP